MHNYSKLLISEINLLPFLCGIFKISTASKILQEIVRPREESDIHPEEGKYLFSATARSRVRPKG